MSESLPAEEPGDPLLTRAAALIELLDEEFGLLRDGDSAALERLARRKLDQTRALESAVQTHTGPLSTRLPAALDVLRRANARNAALLQLRQRHAEAALAEIRGDTPAPVYGSAGHRASGPATRLIAQA